MRSTRLGLISLVFALLGLLGWASAALSPSALNSEEMIVDVQSNERVEHLAVCCADRMAHASFVPDDAAETQSTPALDPAEQLLLQFRTLPAAGTRKAQAPQVASTWLPGPDLPIPHRPPRT
ncbi:hypothetical protein [Cupriavidus pauculus]|uniref:hypothetical protein n=1 Tax=Cupriavidus pauculus TaxID=82633 RepID=UPI001EE2C260|nr:hypothetical protein [Cupriavidus pauculus]GJG98469.1 hypothetical protein CBA19C6_28290 [Cupriavidus pauculus]